MTASVTVTIRARHTLSGAPPRCRWSVRFRIRQVAVAIESALEAVFPFSDLFLPVSNTQSKHFAKLFELGVPDGRASRAIIPEDAEGCRHAVKTCIIFGSGHCATLVPRAYYAVLLASHLSSSIFDSFLHLLFSSDS